MPRLTADYRRLLPWSCSGLLHTSFHILKGGCCDVKEPSAGLPLPKTPNVPRYAITTFRNIAQRGDNLPALLAAPPVAAETYVDLLQVCLLPPCLFFFYVNFRIFFLWISVRSLSLVGVSLVGLTRSNADADLIQRSRCCRLLEIRWGLVRFVRLLFSVVCSRSQVHTRMFSLSSCRWRRRTHESRFPPKRDLLHLNCALHMKRWLALS